MQRTLQPLIERRIGKATAFMSKQRKRIANVRFTNKSGATAPRRYMERISPGRFLYIVFLKEIWKKCYKNI